MQLHSGTLRAKTSSHPSTKVAASRQSRVAGRVSAGLPGPMKRREAIAKIAAADRTTPDMLRKSRGLRYDAVA